MNDYLGTSINKRKPSYSDNLEQNDMNDKDTNSTRSNSGNKIDSPEKGLSIWGAILSFISTIIGGGIVGIPYAFYHVGIPVGIFMNILVIAVTFYSIYLYLKAKDLTTYE